MKTSIIILTFNQLDYTKNCIDSIRQYTGKNEYEIIVVDNNSSDGTVSWLKEQKDIKTIYNKENAGFPKGCNQGIGISSGDNILLLNNDVIVTCNWLDNLIQCLYSSSDIGAVGPITNSASYYQAISVSYQTVPEMQLFAEEINKANSKIWEERLKLVGFCLLIKKGVLDQVGLLDEQFSPGNFEDDDISYRIRLAGFRLMLCKDTFVHHFGGTSFKQDNSRYAALLTENSIKFMDKWGFNSAYSTAIRYDVAKLIDSPEDSRLNILEVGCACGGTLLNLKSKYKNAMLYGIEINKAAARSAALFADISDQDIEGMALTYSEKFFDYILLADVLEHLRDPWKVLDTFKRYLKPGGKLLVSLPNIMHFSVMRRMMQGYWTYEEAGILDKTHLRFFTLYEIDRTFKELGYQVRDYKITTVPETEEDSIFIKKVAGLVGNSSLEQQYRAYQYVFAAEAIETVSDNQMQEVQIQPIAPQQFNHRELIFLLRRIENDIETINNLDSLVGFLESGILTVETILDIVEKDMIKKEELLQILAVSCYERGMMDNSLALLEKAYYWNQQNPITVYNLAYIVFKAGEREVAFRLLEQLTQKDAEAVALMAEIKEALHESA